MWQGILTTLSQSNGHYTYDYGTVPFLAEIFKVYLFMLLIKLYSFYLISIWLALQLQLFKIWTTASGF